MSWSYSYHLDTLCVWFFLNFLFHIYVSMPLPFRYFYVIDLLPYLVLFFRRFFLLFIFNSFFCSFPFYPIYYYHHLISLYSIFLYFFINFAISFPIPIFVLMIWILCSNLNIYYLFSQCTVCVLQFFLQICLKEILDILLYIFRF